MGKAKYWVLGILGAILLIGIIGGVYVYFAFFKAAPLAVLIIDHGTAQYNSDGVWNDARSRMELKQDYSVKTLSDSMAKIIFSDSVMRLDANTEVKLDTLSPEKVSVTQMLGRTWSRLLKISGISDYEVNTPNAIASVRGTGFAIIFNGNNTEIKVLDGTVNVDSMENGTKKASVSVGENKEVIVYLYDVENLTLEDLQGDSWIELNKNLDEEHKQELKEEIMKKYASLINLAKSQYGLTDEQLDSLYDDWVSGKISVKKSIADGTIPPSFANLIPAQFKRY